MSKSVRSVPHRLRLGLLASGLMLVVAIGLASRTQDASGRSRHFHLVKVGNFNFPTYVTGTPADPRAIYVLERDGRVWIVRNGHRLPHPFLDIRRYISIVPNSEQGLLNMAFTPNYARTGTFYVYYTDTNGNIHLARFKRERSDRNRAQPGPGQTILFINHPLIAHYAGQLQFGPRDHDLYIAVGDGGSPADSGDTAQDLSRLLGKILRIDPSHHSRHHLYRIPKGNPFVHRAGARAEIFAYGLRNPWRFSIDPVSGATWIGDVGENRYEEVDYRKRGHLAGTNFGWPRFEGNHFFRNVAAPGAVFPVIEEAHAAPIGSGRTGETWCAVMGGYVVRDRSLRALYGHYLFADHCTGRVFSAQIHNGHAYAVHYIGIDVPDLVMSFGEDGLSHLYIASKSAVYKFVP
jgi:glucose/arabinose dehydrogenase